MKPSLALIAALAVLCAAASCSDEPDLRALLAMEQADYDAYVEKDIRDAIARFGADAEAAVKAHSTEGYYWKLLGNKYQTRGMHREAMKAFKEAIAFFPENPNLYYHFAVSAGVLMKSLVDPADAAERDSLLRAAEAAYERSLELDGRFARSLYGLAVIKVFERGDFEAADALLDRYLAINTRDFAAMFLQAQAKYGRGLYEDAIAVYDRILAETKAKDLRESAEALRQRVRDELP
jgi:tetratricopeptide (TPR) repeat protein